MDYTGKDIDVEGGRKGKKRIRFLWVDFWKEAL